MSEQEKLAKTIRHFLQGIMLMVFVMFALTIVAMFKGVM